MTTRFRAYCDECNWNAPDAWRDEEAAWTDLSTHVQNEHAYANGVRTERDDDPPDDEALDLAARSIRLR